MSQRKNNKNQFCNLCFIIYRIPDLYLKLFYEKGRMKNLEQKTNTF